MPKKSEQNSAVAVNDKIEDIYLIRGQRMMLDSNLAKIYKIETRVLNQAFSRNLARFPKDFVFQLNKKEFDSLISQIVTSKTGQDGRRKLPYVFRPSTTMPSTNC